MDFKEHVGEKEDDDEDGDGEKKKKTQEGNSSWSVTLPVTLVVPEEVGVYAGGFIVLESTLCRYCYYRGMRETLRSSLGREDGGEDVEESRERNS
jgi:hypothetical protein